MKFGETINKFSEPPHPRGISIEGKLVSLRPLVADKHSEELFLSNALDKENINWAYLPYGPFETEPEYHKWIKSFEKILTLFFLQLLVKNSIKRLVLQVI